MSHMINEGMLDEILYLFGGLNPNSATVQLIKAYRALKAEVYLLEQSNDRIAEYSGKLQTENEKLEKRLAETESTLLSIHEILNESTDAWLLRSVLRRALLKES